jgi:hypothetical protein
LSLWRSTLLGLFCTACLADPPTYTGPIPIPPVVAEPQVEPVLGVVHELVQGEDSLNILVPFRSEDLGSPVLGKFLIDVEPGGEPLAVLQSEVRIPASSFTDLSREVRTQVTGLSAYEGCHTLTLVLTQESNTFSFSDRLLDEALAARIEWWFTVPYDNGNPVLLADCPTLGYQLVEPVQ